jgi:2-phospho-L-lactate guanylyltransferase
VRTAAVLPVKRFAAAKQRLGRSLPDPLRRALAEAMLADVLAALADTETIDDIIVVSAEPAAAAAARGHDAIVVHEQLDAGQSAAATAGIERARREGAGRVLCVPGDCPALDPAELRELLASAGEPPEVVIVPDRHGTGTNGLLLTPCDAIAPSFGAGSCERHRGLARAAGARLRVERPPSLLLDVDTGADLAVLRTRLAGQPGRADRTRSVLAEAEFGRAHTAALG